MKALKIKLAELIGKALDGKSNTLPGPTRVTTSRDTLDKGLCDVVMGVDKGDPEC